MLIAVEGIDGSGKGTHSKLIYDKMQQLNIKSKLLTFPNYTTTFFGHEVGRYLNGEFGTLSSVPIEFASILYAGDRLEMKLKIEKYLTEDDIVICDRYTPSNLAHQAGKSHGNRQQELISWIEKLEYDIFSLPRPDLVIWLDMPIDAAMKFVAQKKARPYTEDTLDLHEASNNYLTSVRAVYEDLAKTRSWAIVNCFDPNTNTLRGISSINKEILNHVLKTIDRHKNHPC
jgi:dTMP kinase